MTINLSVPETQCLKPRITVIGVGGAGGNAVNNMIACGLNGVEFVVANTDAQALDQTISERKIQLGTSITQGLGAGSRPDIGKAAAEEAIEEIMEQLVGSHMVFITAGLGGGTGTGATPVVARAAREQGMLTVGVVTKPFHFEGAQRMRLADEGLRELQQFVDTLIIIPNQNLFRVANDQTTFADAFKMADDVLHAGVRGVTDLMVQPGLINLDFADVRSVMSEMGKAMMGTGEADGDRRALEAAEAAIANPLLDEVSMKGAKGVLINITGGPDMTLFEVDEAANRIREEVDSDANIIFGAAFDDNMAGSIRVSLVATGIEAEGMAFGSPGRPSLTAIEGGQSLRTPISGGGITAGAGQHALALNAQQHVELDEPQAIMQPAENLAPEPVTVKPILPRVEVSAPPAAKPVFESVPVDDMEPAPVPAAQFAVSPKPQEMPAASAAPRAQATQPQATDDSFLAPAPARPQRRRDLEQQPEPHAAAALANGAHEPRRPSLFERMTGTGRAKDPRAGDVKERTEPAMASGTASQARSQPASAPRSEPSLVAEPSNRMEVSSVEDDVLDIPAFLRRQAN
jgi:cell division protein FtsZ